MHGEDRLCDLTVITNTFLDHETAYMLHKQRAPISCHLPCEPDSIISASKALDHEKLKYTLLTSFKALHPDTLFPLQLRDL